MLLIFYFILTWLLLGDGSNGVSEIIHLKDENITIVSSKISQFPAPHDSKTVYGYIGGTITNDNKSYVLACGGATHESKVKGD